MKPGSPINRILEKKYHEYPDAAHLQTMLDYARSMRSRIALAKELNELEDQVGAAVAKSLFAKFPELEQQHFNIRERCLDDLAVSTRFCLQAMLLDSVDYLDKKVLHWFREVLDGASFPEAARGHLATEFRSQWQTHLSESSFSWLKPYLDRYVTILEPQKTTA